jgi:hypothetical protein
MVVVNSNLDRYGIVSSLLAAYTDLLMGLMQVLVLVMLLLPLRATKLPGSPAIQ